MLPPVTNRSTDRHEARVCLLVIADLGCGGAESSQFRRRVLGEGRLHLFFVVAGAEAIAEPVGPPDNALFKLVEMGRDVARHDTEMREVNLRRIQGANRRDRLAPGLDLQLRRNKRRHRRTTPEPNARAVSTENIVVPLINMVM